ncbi:MAG: transposase [Ignavibacteria bacterium]|nr:transposase [Ignavibacteria bacterium]HCN36979.1 hypothetical protein [Bacteroidota bacterium]
MISRIINMSIKRTQTPEEIISIIRDHFENRVSIDELSAKWGISKEKINGWIKKLFDEGKKIFDKKEKSELKKIKELERNIELRDRVLKEIFIK